MPTYAPAHRDALQRLLDGEHVEARDRVREWLDRPTSFAPGDIGMEEHRTLVSGWTKELADEGETIRGFPVEYGGEDAVGRSIAGFETLAWGDLSLLVKCGVQFGLFGGAVLHLGTARHHERYLAEIGRYDLPGCFAMSETGHGSNVQAVETTATYDPATDELVVHTPTADARKDYIGNAARDGRMAAVFAQLIVDGESQGVHAVLVPIRNEQGGALPGITLEDCGSKLGLDGVDNGRITFDQVRVPRDALLDRYGSIDGNGVYTSPIENPTKRFFTMLGTLIQGRVSVCGAAVNATKVAHVIAVRRALSRRQFGPPGEPEAVLMDYRTHQRRLLVPLATTYALHFAQDRMREAVHAAFSATASAEENQAARRDLETQAAGVKAIATWHASDTIQACREACGGAGYLRANRFAALKADTDVFTTFEGDNTVLLQLAAKNLLTEYRDEIGDLDALGLARFFAGQVLSTVSERTAVREGLGRLADDLLPGRDDEGDLLERSTQLDLVRWRQGHILSGVARRLKGGIDSGAEPFSVLVECQDHMLDAARAWVDLIVLEAFAGAVAACEDPVLRPVLDRLCSLYALSRIEAERGWYQEHGRLSSTRSKAVIKAVNGLLAEVRDDAELLVEGFGVPERALGDAGRVADDDEKRLEAQEVLAA